MVASTARTAPPRRGEADWLLMLVLDARRTERTASAGPFSSNVHERGFLSFLCGSTKASTCSLVGNQAPLL